MGGHGNEIVMRVKRRFSLQWQSVLFGTHEFCKSRRVMDIKEKVEQRNKRKKNGWNPFINFETEADARKAANWGAAVGIFLIFSYSVQTISLYSTGKDTFGNAGWGPFVADVFFLILAVLGTCLILIRQSVWAAALVTFWFIAEIAGTITAVVDGTHRTNIGWLVMYAALIIFGIKSIRGSWKLRSYRRAAKTSASL